MKGRNRRNFAKSSNFLIDQKSAPVPLYLQTAVNVPNADLEQLSPLVRTPFPRAVFPDMLCTTRFLKTALSEADRREVDALSKLSLRKHRLHSSNEHMKARTNAYAPLVLPLYIPGPVDEPTRSLQRLFFNPL
jgi:hypothetical protein